MSNNKAFSLIEVIVAVSLVVAVAGTGSLLVRMFSMNTQNNSHYIVASGLAQDILSSAYMSQHETGNGPISVSFDKELTINNIRYTRSLSIDTIKDASCYGGKYWQATTKVSWVDFGRQKEVVLTTNLAEQIK